MFIFFVGMISEEAFGKFSRPDKTILLTESYVV